MVAEDSRILKEGTDVVVEEELNGRTYRTIKFPIVIEGGPRYLAGYTIDITESRRAEEELRRINERLALSARAAHLGVWDWNIQKNELLWDDRMYELYGVKREDFSGAYEAWLKGLHPDDRAFSDELSKQAQRGERDYDTEFRVIWPDGSIHYLKAYGQIVRDADGKPLRMTGVNFDITESKRTLEALRKSAKDLKEAQRLARIGSWEWDAAADIIAWSDEYYQIYGLDPAQKPPGYEEHLKAYTPESAARLDAAVKKNMQTGEPYELDLELAGKEGPARWVTARSEALRDAHGKVTGLRGTAQDITERKRTEEERLAHLRFFENMDRIDQAIRGETDPERMMSNVLNAALKLFDSDRAWLFYPCDPDAPTFRVPLEVTKPEYPGAKTLNEDLPMPPEMAQNLREALQSAVPVTYTAGTKNPVNKVTAGKFGVQSQIMTAIYPKQGKPWVFGMHQCSFARVWTAEEIGFMQEIGRRLADSMTSLLSRRDLLESELKLKDAQRLARMGNWTLDLVSGKLSWSDEIYRIFELDPARFGASYAAFLASIHPDDRAAVNKAYTDSVRDRSGYAITHRLLMADGRIKYVEERCQTAYAPDGRPLTSIGTVQDITEIKLEELEKEKLNAALLEKNQEMENFLYITTHDLRSPLVNIQGFSQNLERYIRQLREALTPVKVPEGIKETLDNLTGDRIPGALKFVLESSQKMDALITALLKVSRIGRVEMKPETLEMNALLARILDTLRYQLEDAGGEVRSGDLPPCSADPGAVNQLFTNLLDNAIKYRNKERALVVNVSGEVKGDMVIYTVADNGSGIPPTDLHRIWNVFYRPERAPGRKGEGIGLPMVRRIAEKNGGGIRAESKEGKGSVFYVELPAPGRGRNGKRQQRRNNTDGGG